jgi:undecaprenyl-diphosphatase
MERLTETGLGAASSRSASTVSVRTTTRRHPSDVSRLVLGLALLVWAAIAAGSADPSRAEINLFRLVNQLPDAAGAPLVGIMQLGALIAVPVVAAVCVLGRRSRLAKLILLGGVVAWLVAKGLEALVGQAPPDERLTGVVLHGAVTPGLSFPATHVAVAAAMATVASPYLGRSARRTTWLLVALVAVARVYVGAHFPADVLGGFAVGWVVGSGIHLVFGAPRGFPDPHVLATRLADEGLEVGVIESVDPRRGSFRVDTVDGGAVHVRVADRDRGDADWLYRLWRFAAFRDPIASDDIRDTERSVEHEALALVLAARHGVPTPEVTWTHRVSDSESVLVRSWVDGRDLSTLAPDDDAPIREAWSLLQRLHDAGISHGAATTGSFILTDHGVVVVRLARARIRANRVDFRHDIAEFLASSAAVLGAEEAVRCADEVLSSERLLDALPLLQPLALSSNTRTALRASSTTVDDIRRATAALGPTPSAPAERPVWVVSRNLAPLVLGAIALVVLLAQIGNFRVALDAARNANPVWLATAVLIAGGGYIMAASSLMGAAPEPLALGRTTVVQFAAAFTNRIAPAGIGAMATNIRYLERSGIRRSRAATSVGINAAAGGIVHVALLLTVVPIAGLHASIHLPRAPDLSDYWPIVAAILVALSLAGLWYWRHGLSVIMDRIRPHTRDLRGVLAEPRRTLLLFGGSLGVTTAQAFVFVACLESVGVHLPVLTMIAVFLAGSALAAAAPTPGGLGALEAALVAGLGQVGVTAAPAVAAVLMSRIIGYWFPILPGWLAFNTATRNGTL